MENFSFVSPTQFVFGKGVEVQIGCELQKRKAQKALLHYGGSSAIKSGLIGRVKQSLDEAGIEYVELGGVRPNPEISLVREGVALCKDHNLDWVIAVGGGSVIDSAKAIALAALSSIDPWQFFETKEEPEAALPLAVVLTIPAAGSEASKATVISNDELGRKTGYGSDLIRPVVSFLNPELTFTLPVWQTAAGVVDIYSHLLERYFCPAGSVPVSDNLIISLMRTIRAEAPRVLEDPSNYDARANIMWAGMLCHQGLVGCGRIEDWATHGLEHELSAYDVTVTHGAGLAVMFPAWMMYVYKENPRRFVEYGAQVYGLVPTGDDCADARRAIECTKRFFMSLGMPGCLKDLNIGEDAIEKMIPTLKANKGEPFGNFKKLSMDDARAIYRLAL